MSKKLQKVISVTTSVTTILWISGIAALAPMAAMATTINEGDTIRVANTFDVYIAKYVGSKQFKRLILNPEVFNSYRHLSWSAVKTVTQAEMDSFTNSDLVRALGDTKVYKLIPNGDVGSKQWLNMTAAAFTAAGYDWDSIYTINNVDRDNYTTGADITGGTSASPSTSATPGPAGALTVALAYDTPVAGVAVGGAARVPFTKVNFSAGSDAATITSLTVQRTGLADDAALSSVVLLDQNGNQLGLSQTLNSSHQVIFNETLTIPANTTQSYTLAANMPVLATAAGYAGQIASLSLVAVATTATVSGALPLTGNGQTINGTLVIGTATITAGSLDPGSAATKNIGTIAYSFSSVKVTAGSAEDVTVYSIRWNQSGSAASSDMANVIVSDGTTNYATTVSSDGKYYTANFGSTGIVIAKGLNKDFTIKGDILNSSTRTISFDIYRNTDIVLKGNVYGYYLTPTFTANSGSTGNTIIVAAASPYFTGADVTIGGGSLRVDKSASGAPTANITKGATGQLLGAFDFVVQGEPVNVSAIRLDFDMLGTGSSTDITTITLSKADGTNLSTGGTAVVSTNVSSTLDGATNGYVSFSGAITFPVGTTQVIVKGNLNTNFAANDTFRVGFLGASGTITGPSTAITNITGATTGNTITASPASAIWCNTMTVQGGSLSANITGTPVSQPVIAGSQGWIFSNILFDASASGEDVKVTKVILNNVYTASASTDVYGVQLFDGVTALNTGSNVVTPSATAYTNTFTLDSPLVIAKGTQKTIAVKGNVLASATAADTQTWGFLGNSTSVTASGVSTGQTITVTTTAQAGPTMTIAGAGQYTAVLDSSTPTGKLIAANTTGNIMTQLKFYATSEQVNITKIRLALTNSSSSVNDLSQVYIYDGATLLAQGALGTYNATGGTANASSTFTLSPALQLIPGVNKLVTIKADIAAITTNSTVATAGHQIAINYYGSTSATENLGTGVSSGAQITNYSVTTAQTAAYIFRSVPTVATVALPTTTLSNGTKVLSKFSITADTKGDIDIYRLTFKISTTSPTSGGPLALTSLNLVDLTVPEAILYASTTNVYTDLNGKLPIKMLAVPGTYTLATTTRTIAAGTTHVFELRGTISGSGAGALISTQLEGDSAAPVAMNAGMLGATTIDGDAQNDFIWSDWSQAAHTAIGFTVADFMNGYLVSGLPSSNLAAQIMSQ